MDEPKPIGLNEHDHGLVLRAIRSAIEDCEFAARTNRRASFFVKAAECDLRASHYRRILALLGGA